MEHLNDHCGISRLAERLRTAAAPHRRPAASDRSGELSFSKTIGDA